MRTHTDNDQTSGGSAAPVLQSTAAHSAAIREVLAEHARLAVDVSQLDDDSDLYEAGLTSLTTVNLMLALENRFDVEFKDSMLGRRTFSSIAGLSEAIEELLRT